ncbi:DegT/DnrJ/EryC1/StrS family aminotransferase [Desulfococcaceae bacterium HSG9]|nr:DegT/DnrJ/EryC1/StrS family aminotransferase [Desulfococcaceae bacterium HSG9]
MQVPLLDLKSQYQSIKQDVMKVTNEIFESQYFIMGPHVIRLEQEIAAYCGVKHAVGVSSGTDALLISLMAAEIGKGDLVITTPYTFFATVGSIMRVGARPVFVDIDPDTFNIDPEKLEKLLNDMDAEKRTHIKAFIPVHLYGQCADMNPIMAIAQKYGIVVIEDAAQAIGAEYQGKRAGSIGDLGCFSFFPSKNLGAFGDGGIVTTNSDDLHNKLSILRSHGAKPKYYHKIIGGNFRLDALQAAIVSIKLKYLDAWTQARQENAARYNSLFQEAGLDEWVVLPTVTQDRHIYNQYIIRLKKNRDQLRQFLQEEGIGSEIYYPMPLHLQECFADLDYQKGDFPVAEQAALQTLALPIYPELTSDQQDYVAAKIKAFFKRGEM